MRAFMVRLPSGARYWTVLDEELAVVPVTDSFLRQVRFGRAGHLVQVLYEVADDRDLPEAARPEDGGTGWRMRARHRLHEPETAVDRAASGTVESTMAPGRGTGPGTRTLTRSPEVPVSKTS